MLSAVDSERIETLPLLSRTPATWAAQALTDPLALLADHAFLEMKAANNAMDLLTRWPDDFSSGTHAAGMNAWMTTMTSIARDEGAHLAQVTRLLIRNGGRMPRGHTNPYAKALRLLVRKGGLDDTIDRLLTSALIEARSCERFGLLATGSTNPELAAFYKALFTSELGHYKSFLKLAYRAAPEEVVDARWQYMLTREAEILGEQPPGPRMHSGFAENI